MRDCEALIVLELQQGILIKGHPGLDVPPTAVACNPRDPSVFAVGESTCRVHSAIMRDADIIKHLPPHPHVLIKIPRGY